jgi:hypothetical protein
MPTITVDDVTYTFSGHALRRMQSLSITIAMVEAVMLDPDLYEPSRSSPYMVYVRRLPRERFPLRVAVDEDDRKIVSAHWLTPL